MSHSMYRRRRWRTSAATLALTLGSLVIPAAALADGAIDPNFNGTGYRVSAPGDGLMLAGSVTRVATVVQSDGRIVVGGQSASGFMTLIRYNADGSRDNSFNNGTGIVERQFSGTPAGVPSASGALALTQDAAGNIYVAGFGGSQSQFVARYTAAGTYTSSVVCYAPHLIDYTARALTVRPSGQITLVGFARNRHVSILDPTGATPPSVYGQRATVTLPASGNSTSACGAYVEGQGSNGVTIDGLTRAGVVTDQTRSGRWYEGVASIANNSYYVVSTNGTDAAIGNDAGAWVQHFGANGVLDQTFNAGTGRVSIAGANLHAVTTAADGTVLAAGELGSSLLLARVGATGAATALSSALVGIGGNTGQAMAVQPDGRIIVAGGTNGGAGLALARFTAAGAIDSSFGNAGTVATSIGGNAYITAIGLHGPTIAFAGRATTANGYAAVAGRYYAIGDPPPAPVVVPPVVAPPAGTPGAPGTPGTTTTPVTTPGGTTTTTTTTTPVARKARKKLRCLVPKVAGKKLNKARSSVMAKGCKVTIRYVASKKAPNTVLAQSRKAGKKLVYKAVVKLTVAKQAKAVKKA